MKRSPLKRHPKKDPVTPEMREAVLSRDDWACVAPLLGATTFCRDRWGDRFGAEQDLTLDHVRDHAMAGKRAPSDKAHLVTLCYYHHISSGWATANRVALRAYLLRMEAKARGEEEARELADSDPFLS